MIITRHTPILIYGYGTRGVRISSILHNHGLHVEAYIDRNAARYAGQAIDYMIYGLDDIGSRKIDFSKSVVILAVTNVFEHENIANTLNKIGFKFIIYKSFQSNVFGRRCNELYDRVVDIFGALSIENMDVPEFESAGETNEMAVIDQETVMAVVPVNLLFGVTKKLYFESLRFKSSELVDKIADKSILYFNISRGLFSYFMKEQDINKWKRYFEIYAANRIAQTFDDAGERIPDGEDLERHLNERYIVYQNMEKLFSRSVDFFYQNPPSVIWNEKGYFNIEDGNNRACFLLNKGIYEIPCRMRKRDYEAWFNSNEKIERVQEVLRRTGLSLRAAIPHHSFSEYTVKYYTWSYQKLECICGWLWENEITVVNASVLEMCSQNDLCGQHMARMGADVTSIKTKEWIELCKSIDELLYVCGIQYVQRLEEAVDQHYDLAIFACESLEDILRIGEVKFDRGIVEICGNDMLSDELQTCLGRKKCTKLMERLCGSDTHSLVCIEEIKN